LKNDHVTSIYIVIAGNQLAVILVPPLGDDTGLGDLNYLVSLITESSQCSGILLAGV